MKGIVSFALLILTTCFAPSNIHAQTERQIRYEYDDAGNVTGIFVLEQSAPPTNLSITPNFLHQGQKRGLLIQGDNLINAVVAAISPDIEVSNVFFDNVDLHTTIEAGESVEVGLVVQLLVNTRIGQAIIPLQIVAPLPQLTPFESPIVVSGQDQETLIFTLEEAVTEDTQFIVTITNADAEVISEQIVTVSAGQNALEFVLDGKQAGHLYIQIRQSNSHALYLFTAFNAPSVNDFALEQPDILSANSWMSQNVGVAWRNNSAMFAPAVGLSWRNNSSLFSSQVGLSWRSNSSLFSSPVSLVWGFHISELVTSQVALETTELIFSGFNLDTLQEITVEPVSAVQINDFSVSNHSQSVTVSVSFNQDSFEQDVLWQFRHSNGTQFYVLRTSEIETTPGKSIHDFPDARRD